MTTVKPPIKKQVTCPRYIVHIGGADGAEAKEVRCTFPEGHAGECSFEELIKIGKRP